MLIETFYSVTTGRRCSHSDPKGSESYNSLSGYTVGKSTDPNTPNTNKLIKFIANLRRDIVLWDQLEADGIQLTCSRGKSSEKTVAALKGNELDISDFEENVSVVISIGDWNSRCGYIKMVKPPPSGEQYVFFIIIRVKSRRHYVKLDLKVSSGADIIPEVDLFGIGRIEVGGFVEQDSVLEASIEGALEFSVEGLSSFEVRAFGHAEPQLLRFSRKNSRSGNVESKGGIEAVDSVELRVKAKGFAVFRPSIGVAITFRDRGLKGLVRVSLVGQLVVEGRAFPCSQRQLEVYLRSVIGVMRFKGI